MSQSGQGILANVSAVIPVLNAGHCLPQLLEALFAQRPLAPAEVVLVDSMSTDNTREVAARDPRVRLVPIRDFSHGRARNLGVREARGEMIVLLTQDALPQGTDWLAHLLAPLADPAVGAVFSRQVPRPDAPPTERFFLNYHFPPGEPVRREKRPGAALRFPEDVFFSNVSAAVRRDLLVRFPFDETLIMSEDQQFARDLIEAGFAVVYQPQSVVMHSHCYTLRAAFRRYFDSVYSLTLIFREHGVGSSAAVGLRYLRGESLYMLRRHPLFLPYYGLYVLAKTGGTLAAHVADRLPRSWRRRFSLHRYHWDREA